MSNSSDYQPPKVWTWDTENGGKFANINRPIAGATHDKELPVGQHPLQLYSLATPNGQKVTILLEELLALGHLAAFLPTEPAARAECLSWLFWQMGSAPYLGGGFGHFYAYAPTKIEYAINRFAMETKRQLDVLERQLAVTEYIAGNEYTIADMAIWPWYGGHLALVRRPSEGPALRCGRVSIGTGLSERPALGRCHRRASGGAAGANGQSRVRRAFQPVA